MVLTEEMKELLQKQSTPSIDEEKLTKCSRTYRFKKSFGSRKEEGMAIRREFPNKIPIIMERFSKETSLPELDKSRFVVPQEITMSQFLTIIRNRMKLSPTQAMFMLVNNRSMLSLSKTLAEVYSEHQSDDGFLYITYASQEVFG